jgi:hypothetical protein
VYALTRSVLLLWENKEANGKSLQKFLKLRAGITSWVHGVMEPAGCTCTGDALHPLTKMQANESTIPVPGGSRDVPAKSPCPCCHHQQGIGAVCLHANESRGTRRSTRPDNTCTRPQPGAPALLTHVISIFIRCIHISFFDKKRGMSVLHVKSTRL